MGYFVCKHCGAHLHDSKVKDLYQWDDKDSIGWSYVCPRCGEENYKEIKFP
jgi:DNA-directed RNA polymerase subunit RPC12/RpoP